MTHLFFNNLIQERISFLSYQKKTYFEVMEMSSDTLADYSKWKALNPQALHRL